MEIQETINNIRAWGLEKGITGTNGSQKAQLAKLLEEVGELQHAIKTDNRDEKIDGVGDCTVVLILLSELMGLPFEQCVDTAYNVIKGRTGRMQSGVFIKD
tara:strand:- start:2306 stop:2608 length:303 start_codon:yes stop_codon:yes gene_type:complete